MRNSKYFKGFSTVLFLAAFAPATVFSAEVVERILAVVNDEIVTEQDLQVTMAPVVAQYRTSFAGREYEEKVAAAREEFLAKIIEDKLILSEAKRKQVIVKDVEVDDMLSEVRNKFPTRDIFLKAIEDQGLTEKKLWDRFHDQIMTQKLVGYEVRSRVSVSPGEINEYYKAHETEFAEGDRVRLQHILIRIGSRIEEDARAFAESLYEKIQQGEDFEALAKTYSEGSEAKEGGEMGWMEKGQLMGDIDERVFRLSTGEVTPPIQSSLGFHIFKVVEKKESAVKPLSEVDAQIQEILFKDKLKKRLETWIATLKKNAYISIR